MRSYAICSNPFLNPCILPHTDFETLKMQQTEGQCHWSGPSPSKLRLSQHGTVLFVPLKVSQEAYWEESCPLLPRFKNLKWWTSYQTYLPKLLQALLKNNIKLLLGQDRMKPFLVSSANCAR